MQPPEKKTDAADLFARPSPWGRPPLPTLRVGALPRAAGAPMRPVRAARPNVITADSAPNRAPSSILTGSLTPAASLGPAPARLRAPMDPMAAIMRGPAPAAPPAPRSQPRVAPPVAVEPPAPFVAPAVARRAAKPKGGHAPLIIGATIAAMAGVVAFVVLAGRDAGTSAPPTASPVIAAQATPPPIAPTPEPTVATPPAAAPVAKVALRSAIAPRRVATAPAVTPAVPEPVAAEPAPIVLNPTPVEPPPAAPLALKPYTPPAEPDPEAPITLRGPQN